MLLLLIGNEFFFVFEGHIAVHDFLHQFSKLVSRHHDSLTQANTQLQYHILDSTITLH